MVRKEGKVRKGKGSRCTIGQFVEAVSKGDI